jgi:transcriptional regulator with XRE-family HTH domain
MKNAVNLPIPALKALRKVGKDISNARKRRRITIELMAERAGVSKGTIGKIESGSSTVSIGGYVAVLFVLGMTDKLNTLVDVSSDLIGLQLEEEKLPQRVRMRNNKQEDMVEGRGGSS